MKLNLLKVDKQNTIMSEINTIYTFISGIINTCKCMSHIEPCEVLIDFYEKKGAEKYIIKSLRESLKIRVKIVKENNKVEEKESIEEKAWNMFKSGSHTIGEIEKELKIKYSKIQEIIKERMK